ncbi:MAG: branched-chain amino acid transport system II carrier protein [Candidatus Aminicenantes bacterium]|nr:branched-chain amino acid transport system II carrier protein [Candidatus Aminicenantes bacterium]
MKKKSFDVVLVGFALFAMIFGAGNLIFPPYMGFVSGSLWAVALLGFLITGIGMPLMGVIASSRAGGSVEHLAGRVGHTFARIMSIVVILAIGPLLAIPRTAATTFEMGIKPNIPWATPVMGSVVFFAITLFFALNEATVIDKIGKYLTPFLLITLLLIIVKGIISPIAAPTEGILPNPFTSGFKEGYQTMDAMASIVFAEIIIAALVFKGYKRMSDQVKMASKAALIAAIGLGFVYGGLMYLGATSRSLFPADIERTTLLIGISQKILGGGGKIALGIAVSLACLTTSIGLTATVADYFSNITKEKLSYKFLCVVTVLFSGVFATVGVTKIVQIAVPLLVLIYPVAISLIILTILGRKAIHRAVYIGAVTGALGISVFEALTAAGLPIIPINNILSFIPLGEAGFPWIVPAVVGALIGGLVARREGKRGDSA